MGINNLTNRVCLIPNVSGVGGMVSFRGKLIQGLTQRGIGVSFDLADTPYAAVLVIGGTRNLSGLWRVKRRGVRIVQRLDGMNWIHRKRPTGLRHYFRAEYGNIILSFIRSRLAKHIVYQSVFSQQWWERVYGIGKTSSQVVYNGVDLERYTPSGEGKIPEDLVRILLVEGAMTGGYELGLETAIMVAESINSEFHQPIELMVVGRVPLPLQHEGITRKEIRVNFTGQVPAEEIPGMDRSAHVLYAGDINAACPNSVIEALACGLPVAAFDTGALSEIVTNTAGRLAAYGGDPWNLDPPDVGGLAKYTHEIIQSQSIFRAGARKRAIEAFGLDQMVDGYLEALNL